MKKILFIALAILSFAFTQAQKNKIEKWHGVIGNQKCILQYRVYEKKNKNGMEEDITYKGFFTIGVKKISIIGWFEGNTMRFEEVIKGKKVYTIYFGLSDGDETYELIGKRTINEKVTVIKLKKEH
jgi:hypothetical protein